MASCRPEQVIEQYAHFSSLGGINRGEQGLVVSMNLRWLTHYVRFRQMLGIEPVRYNFAPTSHSNAPVLIDVPVDEIVLAWRKEYGDDRVEQWNEGYEKSNGKSGHDFSKEEVI